MSLINVVTDPYTTGEKKSLIARLIARLRYQTPPAVTDIEAGRARSIAEEMQEE